MDLTYLAAFVTDPLTYAGVILVVGYVITRLAFRVGLLVRLICQTVSFAGFTVMLAIAGVMPFRPTPAMDMTITYLLISFFKVVWWLAASWLFSGFVRTVLVFKRRPMETRFLQDILAGFI